MLLKEHLSNEPGFADLLNYAHVVGDGVIINKDGAFLITYKFRGPDINSANSSELDALTANFNRMVTFLEDGWMLHIDEIRIPSNTYPNRSAFPSIVAAIIDEERRQLYEAESVHYENLQFLTFVWKFPAPINKKLRHWFVDEVNNKDHDEISEVNNKNKNEVDTGGKDSGKDYEKNSEKENKNKHQQQHRNEIKNKHADLNKNIQNYHQNLTTLLQIFINTVDRCIALVSVQLVLERLNTADLLTFLNTCIAGETTFVTTPPPQVFIDCVLSRHNVIGGYTPKIGNQHLVVLSLVGYLNHETIPGLLEEMGTYPLVYRWSNRFIPLSELTAEREIKRYQKNWNNKVKGFFGIVKEAAFGKTSDKINVDALQMSNETTESLTANSNHSTRFGYWTSALVLMNENLDLINQAVKELTKYLEQAGFTCIKEDVNAFDAWLGTIPGHGSCNARRIFLSAINLAHLLPLNSIWAGRPFSSTTSLLPIKSPPVFYAATTGKTPFRFQLDIADVGHQMVVGPTGAGKSTYLGFLIAQFLRYQDAQIFVFDKDYSHHALTIALGGHYYDIGNAEKLAFCPLADLSTVSKKVRAEQFIENLVVLQNIKITPTIRTAIHTAIESLSNMSHNASRNLTVFCSEVQQAEVRAALQYYTIDGQIKLLDATDDSLQSGYLQTFEMNWLLAQKPEIYLPILIYIFDQIESRLEEAAGKKPTLIILEEAWLYVGHEVFARKLRDWLKTLRKKNARVVFATQSLADLYDPSTKTLTTVTATIMESCPTKIYLPNHKMEAETRELYKKMNLNDRQLELLSRIGIPKRHYYIVTPEGNRLINLGFNETRSSALALAFIGLSKERSNLLIEYHQKYQDEWLYWWLKYCGLDEWIGWIEYLSKEECYDTNGKSVLF